MLALPEVPRSPYKSPISSLAGSGRTSPLSAKEGIILKPPCPFVRGIDPAALQMYREGNMLYRLGSPVGSKGEITNIPRVPSWPERTASPF